MRGRSIFTRALVAVVMAASLASLGGCYNLTIQADPDTRGKLTLSPEPGVQGRHFEEHHWVVFWLWGIVGAHSNPSEVLASHMNGDKRVTHLKVWTQHSIVDLLLGGLTLGIVAPISITYEGDEVSK